MVYTLLAIPFVLLLRFYRIPRYFLYFSDLVTMVLELVDRVYCWATDCTDIRYVRIYIDIWI